MNQEQVIEWACEAGFQRHLAARIADVLQYVAGQSAAAEREACAQVCEENFASPSFLFPGARDCAIAIRARGNKDGV